MFGNAYYFCNAIMNEKNLQNCYASNQPLNLDSIYGACPQNVKLALHGAIKIEILSICTLRFHANETIFVIECTSIAVQPSHIILIIKFKYSFILAKTISIINLGNKCNLFSYDSIYRFNLFNLTKITLNSQSIYT